MFIKTQHFSFLVFRLSKEKNNANDKNWSPYACANYELQIHNPNSKILRFYNIFFCAKKHKLCLGNSYHRTAKGLPTERLLCSKLPKVDITENYRLTKWQRRRTFIIMLLHSKFSYLFQIESTGCASHFENLTNFKIASSETNDTPEESP